MTVQETPSLAAFCLPLSLSLSMVPGYFIAFIPGLVCVCVYVCVVVSLTLHKHRRVYLHLSKLLFN